MGLKNPMSSRFLRHKLVIDKRSFFEADFIFLDFLKLKTFELMMLFTNCAIIIKLCDKFMNLSHSLIIIAQFVNSIISSKVFSFKKSKKIKSASKKDLLSMTNLCLKNLEDIGFFKPKEKKPIMLENLRNIFYRMELSSKETRILSSVFASLGKKR
mgnify:CR=1 FL=1